VTTSDSASKRKIAQGLERVLVVEPTVASARLLSELLKDIGARQVRFVSSTEQALETAKEGDPQIIFTELQGPALDGLNLVRRLRHSSLVCRKAPIIMVTAEATAATIIGARDAGVHEFLRKPFTIKDLTRRLEAVFVKPRDWVEAMEYIGPDRRRFNSAEYRGPRKRKSDAEPTDAARVDQALRILKTAINAIEQDPSQAMRAMQAQAIDLAQAAYRMKDQKLAACADRFSQTLRLQAEAGRLNRAMIEAATQPLWAWLTVKAA
jgi:CheY-like chemotaxis protein